MLERVEKRTTRGHSLKLVKNRNKTRVRNNFFSQRVVNVWNDLPEAVVSAPSINSLKNRLDKHWAHSPFKFDYKSQWEHTQPAHARDDSPDSNEQSIGQLA